MTTRWAQKWSRLTQMSWDEIRTRFGQATNKRLDFAYYQMGLRPRTRQLLPSPSRSVKFFLDVSELPKRSNLLREHLPKEVGNIIDRADRICCHKFDLLGYEGINYGSEIDWHLDAVHRKRAPLKPWYKIDFLNFSEVGDHKIIWELNRHQHLVTLAKAWCLSGERRFADELCAQWYSWQKANPYPLGCNWASTLEVAFRSFSWIWVRQLIAGCPSLPVSFETDLLQGLWLNGRYIERYLSTYFSPNTHLLGEAVALFYIGALCPEIPTAGSWQEHAWHIILREADRQVRPDGVYFEQALYYHVYALDFFLYARILAELNGLSIPRGFEAILRKMLDFLYVLSQSGSPEGFGDDDGGRVFNPHRNRIEHMTDPLAIGALVYAHEEYANAASLTEEAIWLFGETAIAKLARQAPDFLPSSHAFHAGGAYLMCDNEPCRQQMMIDGGPQGTGHCGHGHADALSLRFSVGGQRILIDPGTCVYISDGDERNRFRGTAAHNTLTVDGVDQAVPQGPFAWNSIPQVKTERWTAGESFELFVGSHDGYARLPDPVIHRRLIFHVKGGFWLVRDIAEGRQEHLLKISWHFAPGLELVKEKHVLTAKPPDSRRPARNALAGVALLSADNPVWKAELFSGCDSPAYGARQSAPAACFSARVALRAECSVLIVPLAYGYTLGTFSELHEPRSTVRSYRYDLPRSTRYVFLCESGEPWCCGAWASDANLLYGEVEDGRLTRIIMVSGSFAKWQDKDLLVLQEKVECSEWRKGKTYAAANSTVKYSAEANIEFFHPVV